MYLNIGGNAMIKYNDIVAILDMETTSISKKTREFFKECERRGQVVNVAEDIPKSYILCGDKIYISQISSATLLKRVE